MSPQLRTYRNAADDAAGQERSWADLHNGVASMRLSGIGIGMTRSSRKPVALTSASNCFAVRSRRRR